MKSKEERIQERINKCVEDTKKGIILPYSAIEDIQDILSEADQETATLRKELERHKSQTERLVASAIDHADIITSLNKELDAERQKVKEMQYEIDLLNETVIDLHFSLDNLKNGICGNCKERLITEPLKRFGEQFIKLFAKPFNKLGKP